MPALPEADLEHILAHTRDLWEPMRGQNLFVTGGTGFFGRWLVESFVYANERLHLDAHMAVLTRNAGDLALRNPRFVHNPSVAYISGDVRHLRHDRVAGQVSHSGRFHFLIHAAMDSVGQEDPLAVFDTIVAGTRAVLDFSVAAGTERLLFTSSGAVYGRQPSDLTHMPESYPGAPDCTQPTSAYGEGKRAAELLCAAYHMKYPALIPIIARCFAFVGPILPLDAHFAIGNFIRDAMAGGSIKVGGDGTPYRSYLYAADLAVWLWTLLFRGQPNYPYNVGSEEDLTIRALAETVAGCFPGKNIGVSVAREPVAGTAPSRYVPSARLAKSELGLTTFIPLSEAISRTAQWHLRQP